MTVDQMIEDILENEGGYSNNPHDKGGATNHGITIKTLTAWRNRLCTEYDVKTLKRSEAAAIYRSEYYTGPKINQLPELIQPVLFDMAVNHGPVKAVTILQKVLNAMIDANLVVDGKIGPKTASSASMAVEVYKADLVKSIVDARKAFYEAICDNDPSQLAFLKGWLKRADSFIA